MNLIETNIDIIFALYKQYKVKELFIFGSILTQNFLVQFENIDILDYFDNYMDFKEKLEGLLGRPVDLLENQAIRNPIFRKVLDREIRLVYER
jgi:predicted nucleotidyltransferase